MKIKTSHLILRLPLYSRNSASNGYCCITYFGDLVHQADVLCGVTMEVHNFSCLYLYYIYII